MIKLAVIGIGRMGTYHTNVARTNANVTVTHLINPSPLNIPTGTAQHLLTHHEIIGAVDAAIVATPTPTHFGIVRDLLNAGIHVLVEKPIAPTLSEAEELFSLARKNSCILQVGYVERFNPAFIVAQQVLTGTPRHIRTMRAGPFASRVAGDSVVLDLMIHDIDLVCTLLNQAPHEIVGLGKSHLSHTTDTASALLRFKECIASCSVHRGAASGTRDLIIESDTQTIRVDLGARTVVSKTDGKEIVHEVPTMNPLGKQLAWFVKTITNSSATAQTDYQTAQRVLSTLLTHLQNPAKSPALIRPAVRATYSSKA